MKQSIIILSAALLSITLIFFGCTGVADDHTQKLIPVEVTVARSADSVEAAYYSGTIEESETVPLSFSSLGTVSQVYVNEGAQVKKGQLLATLDSTTYLNTYTMAHSAEQQAEDAYNRLTPMYKNGNLPEIKYVEVQTALQQARAAAAIARKNLHDCKLYATTDGFIGKRSIEPGMTIVPGMASITLVKIGKVFARISVPESEVASVKKGSSARVKIGALNNHLYDGIVDEIGVVADPLVHSYRVKVRIENKNYEMKPGMICSITLKNSVHRHGVVVPSRAVLVDETGQNYVYVIESEKRSKRKLVQTGALMNDGIEITAGMQEGDVVVVSGQYKLVDNSYVQIVNR